MQLSQRTGAAAWGQGLLQRLLSPSRAAKAKQDALPRAEHILVLGHSHIQALIDAETNRIAANRSCSNAITFIKMLNEAFHPNVQGHEGGVRLNPALAEHVQTSIAAAGGQSVVIDCVSGNEYHFFGLVQHCRPFDFVLPSAPELPLEAEAEIIPTALVVATVRHSMEYACAILSALRATTTLPIWHVQSPPPIRSQAHILAHPTQFKDAMEKYGVAPPLLRWKLWQLQSQLYREACEATGIGFLSVPPDAVDADGYLLEAGWNPDPTHANSWYGELVLGQITSLRPRDASE